MPFMFGQLQCWPCLMDKGRDGSVQKWLQPKKFSTTCCGPLRPVNRADAAPNAARTLALSAKAIAAKVQSPPAESKTTTANVPAHEGLAAHPKNSARPLERHAPTLTARKSKVPAPASRTKVFSAKQNSWRNLFPFTSACQDLPPSHASIF